MSFPVLSALKNFLLPSGRAARTIQTGPFRGIKLMLDLHFETRMFLGLYERDVSRKLPMLCEGIRTAIDIGTSEGLYACYLLAKTKAEKIYSFEPDATCRHLLDSNLELNGFSGTKRIVCSRKFVGAADSDATATMDSLGPVLFPCFVKMDIEGAEVEALRGGATLLAKGDVRWLIETHALELEQESIRIFQAAGYQTLIVKNTTNIFLKEHRPMTHNRWLLAARKPMALV